MLRSGATLTLTMVILTASAQKPAKSTKPVPVPQAPPASSTDRTFLDKHYHVSFKIPPGWELNHKDGQISTFHLDARSAPGNTQLRSVALIDFNPFPYSTLAGALFYFSVEPKTTDAECANQAMAGRTVAADKDGGAVTAASAQHKDVQDIAGMPFTHGHSEVRGVCVEARDEVYTAWRRHACYRFDLAINTFCPEGSGAQPISDRQIHDINERMTNILSTVVFGWEKSGPHPVPVPEQPAEPAPDKPRPDRSGVQSSSRQGSVAANPAVSRSRQSVYRSLSAQFPTSPAAKTVVDRGCLG